MSFLIIGCGRATDQSNAKDANDRLRILTEKVVALDYALRLASDAAVTADSEPSDDVRDGVFLGRVDKASTGDSEITIDFVTPQMDPRASELDRRRSSWPRHFGWNRIRHPQLFTIDKQLTVFVIDPGRGDPIRMNGVSMREFLEMDHSNLLYYFSISDQEVQGVWPWDPY